MKKCAICGQRTQRGSFCVDCRAALKRARDETISQFQMRPAMALAGTQTGVDRENRSIVERPRRKSSLRVVAEPRATAIALPSTPAVKRAPGWQGSRSAWVVIAVIVAVVSYVGYRMIFGTAEHVSSDDARMVPSAPALGKLQGVPILDERELGRGVRERTNSSIDAKASSLAPRASESIVAVEPIAPSIATGELKAVAPPAFQIIAPAPRSAAHPTLGAVKLREARKAVRTPENAALPALSVEQASAPTEPPAPAPEPVVIAKSATPSARSASRAPARLDHWQRMQLAERECQNEPFFGRLVCEQSVRNEYCAGQWGQMAECPGNPVN